MSQTDTNSTAIAGSSPVACSPSYVPGMACRCAASSENECACVGVDWTPSEVYRLRRERDEWKAKFIQQNKDLGCELMDPNGTIWDYAERLQREMTAAIRVLKHCRLFISERRGYHGSEEIERDSICASISEIILENAAGHAVTTKNTTK